MITMWRSVVGEMKKSEYEEESVGFKETNVSFDPKTKLTVGLSRYSAAVSYTHLDVYKRQVYTQYDAYTTKIRRSKLSSPCIVLY